MHLKLRLRVPLIVLTIVDLCVSVPNFVEHANVHKNNNDNYIDLKSNEIDTSDDGSAKSSDTSISSSKDYPLDFLITNFLSDGEIERRIQCNGITAKETLVSKSG